jgi:hypothetical protein
MPRPQLRLLSVMLSRSCRESMVDGDVSRYLNEVRVARYIWSISDLARIPRTRDISDCQCEISLDNLRNVMRAELG